MTASMVLNRLRAQAHLATLFPPTTLADAMRRLGFVQADPIQAPARAQDLILRHPDPAGAGPHAPAGLAAEVLASAIKGVG